MSDQATEPEFVELPAHGDAAFAVLLDALAPEETPAEAGADGAAAEAGAAGDGAADGGGDAAAGAAAAGAAAGADVAAGAAAGGDGGAADGGAQQPAAPAGDGARPATWTADAAALGPKFGELSTAIEEKTQQAYQATALEEVKQEYGNYFEALQQHPRLLVGRQVPAIGKEGMETLRDTNDAREWQEAVKTILVAEVNDRAGRQLEESRDFLSTVHASIELFQNNPDLVPGTKNFDVDLANRFATLAEPYELRVDGKLQGYSVPVQPLIEKLRAQVAADRAKAAPAAPAAPAAAAPAAPVEPPQAGIQSKAGSGTQTEDFSTLFGTIGLPNLQI